MKSGDFSNRQYVMILFRMGMHNKNVNRILKLGLRFLYKLKISTLYMTQNTLDDREDQNYEEYEKCTYED